MHLDKHVESVSLISKYLYCELRYRPARKAKHATKTSGAGLAVKERAPCETEVVALRQRGLSVNTDNAKDVATMARQTG